MELDQRVTKAYEELRMDIYRYLLAIGLPSQAAQDITQDCFIRLYETLHGGETVQNSRSWLLRVAHNLGINIITAKGFETDEIDPDEPAVAFTAETRLIEEERRERLRREISQLSVQQRSCLELRAQGLRYREIGEIIGISTSTVGEFLRRAISRLRRALSE